MVLLTKSYMDFLGKSFRAWCNLLRLRKIHSIGVRIQTVRASNPSIHELFHCSSLYNSGRSDAAC
jgi:hypothetical protein